MKPASEWLAPPPVLHDRFEARARAGPIIRRELRAEARNLSNYWLRFIGAALLALLFALFINDRAPVSATFSIRLFTSIHTFLLAGIWMVGPALTCDAIGRERREGTLRLLFGTSLTPSAIVLGKGFVHMARLATLWLAAFPILTVAFLLGGVTGLDLLSAFTLELCAGLWALGLGLVISSVITHPVAAFFIAEVSAFALGQALRLALASVCLPLLSLVPGRPGSVPDPVSLSELSLALCTGRGNQMGWSWLGAQLWLPLLALLTLVSILGFCLLLIVASERTRRLWRDQPVTLRQLQRRQTWLAPRFRVPQLLELRSRWLDRNPLGWLHQSSVWPRVSKLSLSGLVLFVNSFLMMQAHPWEYFEAAQIWLALFLSVHMTIVSLMSFRRDRETGLLELLLITPMSVERVLALELAGFWRRFWLPLVLFLALPELMLRLDMASPTSCFFRTFVVLTFLTTPLIGFYASARFKSFLAGLVLTAVFSLFLPVFGPQLGFGMTESLEMLDLINLPGPGGDSATALLLWTAIPQTLMALGAAIALKLNLEQRRFVAVDRRTADPK